MKAKRHMTPSGYLFAGVLATQLLAGCATPPPPPAPPPKPLSYAVLLDNADGSVGAITVTGAKGTVTVDQSKNAVNLDGATPPYRADDSKLQNDFGAALAARPHPPATFLLYFELGGTQLTPESQALIARIIDDAAKRSVPDISVIGHTDTAGDAAANEKLGLQRAQTVTQLITGAGLKALEITVTSHGERDLLVKTPDNTAEPKNRRVEVTIR